MFGFGKSKTEKQVLKLERIMMAIEAAYEKGQLDAARYGVPKQERILHWLRVNGEWSEQQIEEYLVKRNLVRSVTDQAYADKIADALMVM